MIILASVTGCSRERSRIVRYIITEVWIETTRFFKWTNPNLQILFTGCLYFQWFICVELLVLAFYFLIATYIDDYYNFTIPPENLMFGNSYFNFTGVNLFRENDIGKVLIYDSETFLTIHIGLDRMYHACIKNIFVTASRA